MPLPRAQSALAELTQKGMLHADLTLTEPGEAALSKLTAERQATLTRLLAGWKPEQHADITRFLTNLSQELGTSPARVLTGAGPRGLSASRS